MTRHEYMQAVKDGNIKEGWYEKESELEDMTVPDQTLSINEILTRFSNGEPLTIGRKIYYDNVDNFDDIDETLRPDFDLSDVSRIQEEILEERAIRKAKKDKEDAKESIDAKDDEELKSDENSTE